MHYLLMIHAGEAGLQEQNQEQIVAVIQAVEKFDRDLSGTGQNLGSIRLHPSSTSTVIRVRGGEVLTTDGPFIETKEQLGGIYIIEAADQAEAARIAARLPMAQFGSVEVRQVSGIDLRTTILQEYDD
jgi:hypothetical protein